MSRQTKTIQALSINNIIIQDNTAKLEQEIKQFFRPQTYPTFPVNDLITHPNYSSDQRFYLLATQLKDWNKRVQSGQLRKDSKAELCRNKFLYTSLKSILVHGSRGSVNYETVINKLYDWWRKNSKDQIPLYFTTRKGNNQDEDWQVRKTFKSNMPLELRNYERRALFTSQEDMTFLHSIKPTQLVEEKLVDYSAIKEFNSKNFKLRQDREEQEVKGYKSLFKYNKMRFEQNQTQNHQYYKGDFGKLSKTASLFGLKSNKLNQSNLSTNKNSSSFSLLSNQKDELEKIKKYRLNYIVTKKSPFLQQRQSNLSKTAKSFFTTKPYDATTSNLDQNLRKTQKLILTKQISAGVNQFDQKSPSAINKDKQNVNKYQVQFQTLNNWGGSRLMSNPFQNKKLLKKKKKN